MIKMAIKDSSLKILTKFGNISKGVKTSVTKELNSLGMDIRNNIILKMHDTKKQSKTVGKRGQHPSMPGSPPAIDSGHLSGNFEVFSNKSFMEVGTNVEYAKFLQEGAKPALEPRPFLAEGLDGINIEDRLKSAIMKGFEK